jgi:Photosynthesis system II assembly factor YCF48
MPGMLRRGLAAEAGAAGGNDCPDSEILAAYFDHSLDADETARYDLHFSRCATCRLQLAAMARASDGSGDVKVGGGWNWLIGARWLAPVAATFAVLILVAGIVVHMRRRDLANDLAMSGPPGPVAQIAGDTAASSDHNSAETSGAPDEPIATPARPVNKTTHSDRRSSSSASKMKASEETYRQALAMASRKKEIEEQQAPKLQSNPVTSETSSLSARETMQPGITYNAARGAVPARAKNSDPNAQKSPAEQTYSIEVQSDETQKSDANEKQLHARASAKSSPGHAGANAGSVTPIVPLTSSDSATAPSAAPAPAAAATPPPTATLSAKVPGNDAAAWRARTQQAMLSSNLAGIEIATPDAKVLWIVSDSGVVARSDDDGATWKYEKLPNDDHFVASSAPTTKICWLVGERGTILRTVDGKTWASVSSPKEANYVGFSRVEAKNESIATVTTIDDRSFSTADGGKTWKLAK